jgi:hypothetical protein
MKANVGRAARAIVTGLSIASVASICALPTLAHAEVMHTHLYSPSNPELRSELRLPPSTEQSSVSANVRYLGGHVISHVRIVAVMWTSKVYSGLQSQVDSYFKGVVDSTYMDWMGEYDTAGVKAADGKAGTSQHIGHGSFIKTVTITPSITKTSISDSQIGTELAAQIANGNLPAPEVDKEGGVNTLYVVYFPPGVAIQDSQGGVSCNSTGGGNQVFCGYHSSYSDTVGNVPYAVIPDLSSNACLQGCGVGNAMDDYGLAASHEMIEAITDTEVGVGNNVGRPMGWYDSQQGEIGDICANQVGANTKVNGFTVQKEWSQRLGACVALDAKLPACDGTNRPCTACTQTSCSGSTPVCDEDTGTCKGCSADSDCSSGDTCNTKTGTCEGKSGSGGAGDAGAGGTGGGTGGSGSGSGGGLGGGTGSGGNGATAGNGTGGSGSGGDGSGGDTTTTQSGGCAMSHGPSNDTGVPFGLALVAGLAVASVVRRRR